MGWTEQRQHWQARLSYVNAWPLAGFLPNDLEWLSRKRWENCSPQLRKNVSSRNSAVLQEEGGLRVSFPLRLGLGFGTGSMESASFALRIVQIKFGSERSYYGENSAAGVIRNRGQSERVGRTLQTAGNVINAASVLLLSQAFSGPLVSLAMTCMAGVEVTRFAIRQLSNLLCGRSEASNELIARGFFEQVHEFSIASLLLSIGVPILKRHCPEIHNTLECVGAAIPVALGYAETAAKVQRAPAGDIGFGDQLWRERHRWAASRLCGHLTDFRHPPTIGWLVDIWEKSSIIIIPNILSDRTWVIGSTCLPLGLPLNRNGGKKIDITKAIVPQRQSWNGPTTGGVDYQMNQQAYSSGEGYGQLVVLGTGRAADSLYLEFSVVQSGWRWLQQRSSLILRGCYLLLVFGPLIIFGPVIYCISTVIFVTWRMKLRKVLWWLLRFCLEKGGAAFIKWGQWSATREDLFPEDLCNYLGRLHDRAPEHPYSETRKAVIENLGRSIEEIFEDFPQKPCASGSIAQVYKAKLKDRREGMPTEVAVKVRHPLVGLRIYQDFQIMAALANWAQQLPALRWLKLRESVDQFSHTLTAQADLRVEAENLSRFHQNFEPLNKTIIFPKLIPDLVSEGVIVEGFESGQALHQFLRNRTVLNSQIAAAGVDAYLKMLLTDNFVHTDLHPGNILARSVDDGQDLRQKLQLVLLDFGLAEELSPIVRYHFLSLIMMIGASKAKQAAYHLLQFSWPHKQTCRNPDLLVKDMEYLFVQECNLQSCPIDLNKVLIKILQLCRKHEVTIDSAYASLVVAVCVLVAFARSLDPELSIMDAAVPCLFLYNLTGRIMGRIYG